MWRKVVAAIVMLVVVAFVLRAMSSEMRHVNRQSMQLQAQLHFVAGVLEQYQQERGALPSSIELLTRPESDGFGPYLKPRALLDPWGAPLFYRRLEEPAKFIVFSLGADGMLGGQGNALDRQAINSGTGD